MKKNCWEVLQCGLEPGGAQEKELGVCPAASDSRLDGTNQGLNAERICCLCQRRYAELKCRVIL